MQLMTAWFNFGSPYVLLVALVGMAVEPVKAAALTTTFSTTFTNPAPQQSEEFGCALAAVGQDHLLIGAWKDNKGAGSAYLFHRDGTLVSSFADAMSPPATNPAPQSAPNFGLAVAGVGNDRVLIGAPFKNVSTYADGAAFLFSTGGNLLVTFSNPSPRSQDQFGRSVTGVGSDKVLIGSPLADVAGANAGAAYLFDTNGTLLRTFTRVPSVGFGMAVAASGADHVIIAGGGTNILSAGALVYLYHVDGTLVTTFTNPAPTGNGADRFGWSVAPVGSDKVLIGASYHAGSTGEAYLFCTNGTLLTTFTNPSPSAGAEFGRTVAGLGLDKVAVAAHKDDSGSQDGGVVHVFSTNGTLLATITNPPPRGLDYFGYGMTTLGADQVAVGAVCRAEAGYFAAGTAYLVAVAPELPFLTMECLSSGDMFVSWPKSATGFVLEASSFLPPAATNLWSQVPYPYQTNETRISVTLSPGARQFFRLRKE